MVIMSPSQFDNPPKTYIYGEKILCTTYLKTNLIYDLETNSAGKNGTRLTNFTKIFYHDSRNFDQTKFNDRYLDFQLVIPDPKPGMKLSPMMVDVMFEVVNILDG